VTGSVQGIGLAIAGRSPGRARRIAVHGLAGPRRAEAEVCARTQGVPARPKRGSSAATCAMPEAAGADRAHDGGDRRLGRRSTSWSTMPASSIPPRLAKCRARPFNAILAVNLSAAFHTMHASRCRRWLSAATAASSTSPRCTVSSPRRTRHPMSPRSIRPGRPVARSRRWNMPRRATSEGRRDRQLHLPGLDGNRDHRTANQRTGCAEHGGDRDAGIADLLKEKQPSQRTSDPSEIGALALWLCAPSRTTSPGRRFPIDGGWTAQ
jgi:3-hydroxybutyrate dehydrogenase